MSDIHEKIMNIQITSASIGGAIEQAMKYDNDQESRLALAYKIGHRAAYLRQQAKIDKLRAVLQELVRVGRNCESYFMAMGQDHSALTAALTAAVDICDVPVGIVERMDAVLADHIPDTGKKE